MKAVARPTFLADQILDLFEHHKVAASVMLRGVSSSAGGRAAQRRVVDPVGGPTGGDLRGRRGIHHHPTDR